MVRSLIRYAVASLRKPKYAIFLDSMIFAARRRLLYKSYGASLAMV